MGEDKKKSHGFLSFLKTKGRLPLLLGGAVLGIFLLLFGGIGEGEAATEESDEIASRAAELVAYEERLEKELVALCEAVSGVGDPAVMITFEDGYSVRYTENAEGEIVSVGSGSNEQALFETVLPPSVVGVGIVCRGGDRAAVQQILTELVSTTLGIPANRVYVTGK